MLNLNILQNAIDNLCRDGDNQKYIMYLQALLIMLFYKYSLIVSYQYYIKLCSYCYHLILLGYIDILYDVGILGVTIRRNMTIIIVLLIFIYEAVRLRYKVTQNIL